MLLIGSLALKYNGIDIGRKPADMDLVATYDDTQKFIRNHKPKAAYPISSGRAMFVKLRDGLIVEIEIAWPGSRAEKLLKFIEEDQQDMKYVAVDKFGDTEVKVASLELLLLLKLSHRYFRNSVHTIKTLRDIQLLRKHGVVVPEAWNNYLKSREADTYTYHHPKLNVKKDEFFDGEITGVHQEFQHDDIHRAIAIFDKPAYNYFKLDESEVFCSKEMFFSLPREIQVASFVEEAGVLAIERSLVPFPGGKTPYDAWHFGLLKCMTSIASGWWREACWEGYDEALAMYQEDYYQKFLKGVESGLVRRKEN